MLDGPVRFDCFFFMVEKSRVRKGGGYGFLHGFHMTIEDDNKKANGLHLCLRTSHEKSARLAKNIKWK
jgi:hypothetical protein